MTAARTIDAVVEQFYRQVVERPDAVAVRAGGKTVRYRELLSRARAVSNWLDEQGIAEESAVAVVFADGLDRLAALFGILEARAVYVPIDPAHPRERIEHILNTARPRCVLGDPRILRGLSISVPVGNPAVSPVAAAPLTRSPCAHRAAYLIFTSGSTGRPKGVLVEEGALARVIAATQTQTPLGPDDVYLALFAPSFDASMVDLVWPLSVGATLAFPDPGHERDPGHIVDCILSARVSALFLVPSMLRLLSVDPRLEQCSSLRLIWTGGEELTLDLYRRLRARCPWLTIVHAYGPTETAIISTAWRVGEESGPIPIGSVYPDLAGAVVDSSLRPVVGGDSGELVLGGAQLARGYLGDPGLTAARFLPAANGGPGSRIYRTGDRVRQRADGALQFLGRSDHQVKLRGVRIELGEIEAALRDLSGKDEVAVVLREDTPGRPQLVAYLAALAPVDRFELASILGRRLMPAMVPTAYVVLPTLPLTRSGKVDREALPPPTDADLARRDQFVEPRSAEERELARLWSEVLGIEAVGADDDFFALGGDSLAMARLASRIAAELGAAPDPAELFRTPRLDQMASLVASRPSARVPAMQARDRKRAPLSRGQRRLWFVHQLDPGPGLNVACAHRIRGALDLDALERALDTLVRRHHVLHSVYRVDDHGTPYAEVVPPGPFELVLEPCRSTDLTHAIERAAWSPFDLETETPFRARLLTLSPDDSVLVTTLHHIATDGLSMSLLHSELTRLYLAERSGRTPELPAVPLQYGDFAAWESETQSAAEREEAMARWAERLRGAPGEISLPFRRRGRQAGESTGARRQTVWSPDLWRGIESLSHLSGASTFMIMSAALRVLLHRYSGQRDLVIGAPVSTRRRPELAAMVGLFVNLLPLRARLAPDATVAELLATERDVCLAAFSDQDLPFDDIVEAAGIPRRPERPALFQVTLAHQPWSPFRLDGVEVSPLPGHGAHGQFQGEHPPLSYDLSLEYWSSSSGLVLNVLYKPQRLEGHLIEEMIAALEAILRGMIEDPSIRVAALPRASSDSSLSRERGPAPPAGEPSLLSDAEQHLVLREWNRSGERFSGAPILHASFVELAGERPSATAIVAGERSLTYGELHERSSHWAAQLQDVGIRRGDRVGVCFERSIEMVVALYAILEAGAAYVPLDPKLPRERLDYMAALVELDLVLCHAPTVGGAQSLAVPSLSAEQLGVGGTIPRPVPLDPDDLAYVIFTSGSTGRPKGVGVSHGAIANNLAWGLRQYPLAPSDRVFQTTHYGFDVSLWELFRPLMAGATMVLAEPGHEGDPHYLAGEIDRAGVTVLHMVPSLLAAFVSSAEAARCASLRVVIAAGEALPLPLSQAFYAAFPDCELHDLYGPTEAAVYASFFAVPKAAQAIPIGRPVANTELYIATDELAPVPIGISGELLIAGSQLARGYVSRPDLTAERFVPCPWGERVGARMYRTGDRCRYWSDGNVEYQGRTDHQVKIRGYRIELGEIEAVLHATPGIAQAVVVTRGNDSATRLVGYLVAKPGIHLAVDELRERLGERLPEYMIPSALVVLDSLPLNPNGKIDRKALPDPSGGAYQRPAYLAPRSATEEILAGLWQEVLGVAEVGAEDDFLALGGHSLTAFTLLARIRSTFEVELPLRAVLAARTLGRVAAAIDAAPRSGATQGPVPIPRTGHLPLSFAQHRMWYLCQLRPDSEAFNLPFAFRLRGPFDEAALERAMVSLLARHEGLRSRFVATDGVPGVVIDSTPTRWPVPAEDLTRVPRARQPREIERRLGREARAIFDLARGPLLRARRFELGDDERILMFTFHHLITDGGSMGKLWRDLSALYVAELSGKAASLPELPVQVVDVSAWERARLDDGRMEELLGRWRRRLEGAPRTTELRGTVPAPTARVAGAGELRFELGSDSSQSLRDLARALGTTSFAVLIAAWRAFFYCRTGQHDQLLGITAAGRDRRQLEDLVGYFVNNLVLRARVDGDATLASLVRAERDELLGALEAQDAPFDRVVHQQLGGARSDRPPLFQILFNAQDPAAQSLSLQGATVSPIAVRTHAPLPVDLEVQTFDREDTIGLVFVYDRVLFDDAALAAAIDDYRVLTERLLADPELPIGRLDGVSLDEGRPPLADDRTTLISLVEDQVDRSPEAVAVTQGGRSWTYRELDARANQIAEALREAGAGPETVVGIALGRGFDLIATIVAAGKAGAAYLPLDPSLPLERLAFMCRLAPPLVIVVNRGSRPAIAGLRIAMVDVDSASMRQRSTERLGVRCEPDGLAYAIFTSGSTGRPKGVMVSHRAIVNELRATQLEQGPIASEDVYLQLAPYTFDQSVHEIFWPLSVGARLVLVEDGENRDPVRLAEIVASQAVTVMECVPSLLRVLLVDPGLRGCPSLRRILLGGEALPVSLMRELFSQRPDITLMNGYGPTETAVTVTSWRCQPDSSVVSIGAAWPGTRCYVLRPDLVTAADGVGELYIGGVQVARGYASRPGLTAERFLPDPSGLPGSRMYRSGDRVRSLASGELEYLGRVDSQVKIGGLRIELGEIEAVMEETPGVRTAVALVREDRPGDRRIVGYLVGSSDLDVAAVRSQLDRRVPPYMVPQAFVVLSSLPVTAHGKIDRAALPAPDSDDSASEAEPLAPRTPVEARIASVWAEVLGRQRIGVEDDFFSVGGRSLLAVELLARVGNEFGARLSLNEFLLEPTIANMARLLSHGSERRDEGSLAVVPRRSQEGPCSPLQSYFHAAADHDPLASFVIGVAGWSFRGPLDAVALQRALRATVERHPILRTAYQQRGDDLFQRVLAASELPEPLAPIVEPPPHELVEDSIRAAVAELTGTRFDLVGGEVLRARILRRGPDDHALLLAMHHIAGDAPSQDLLCRDLAAAYAHVAGGSRNAATDGAQEPPFDYLDFATFLSEHRSSAAGQASLRYWERLVADAEPLELPVDHHRGAVDEARAEAGAAASFPWSAVRAQADEALARAVSRSIHNEHVTGLTYALAALAATLGARTGQRVLCLQTSLGARPLVGGDEVIGPFNNPILVRFDIEDGLSYRDLLAQGREGLSLGFQHALVPVEWEHSYRLNLGFLDSRAGASWALGDVAAVPLPISHPRPRTPFDLRPWLDLGANRLAMGMVYNRELFDHSTVESLVAEVLATLARMAENPGQAIRDPLR